MVIDHSVIADVFGTADAFERNVEIEYERNRERYQFLRWGQTAFDDFKVVPPGTGIVHQVNIEHLARTVITREVDGELRRLPRHLRRHRLPHHDGQRPRRARLGRRRHRGRGRDARPAGLDAHPARRRLQADRRAARRAPPPPTWCSRSPRCCASTASSASSSSSTATASPRVPLANRATIGNMSPEFGSTAAMFPIDERDPRLPARSPAAPSEQVALVEAYAKEQGLWHDPAAEPRFSEYLELDLVHGRPVDRRPEAPAGPHRARPTPSEPFARRRSRDYVDDERRRHGTTRRRRVLPGLRLARPHDGNGSDAAARPLRAADGGRPSNPAWSPSPTARVRARPRRRRDRRDHLLHQHLEPVGDDRRRAAGQEGRREGPDPQAVGQDHARPRLQGRHRLLRARPASRRTSTSSASTSSATAAPPASATPARCREEISEAVNDNDLAVTAVLSGNRNFEGRINPDVKMNYLASPPLVVAYALAGSMDFDFDQRRRWARTRTATTVFLRRHLADRRRRSQDGRRLRDRPGDVHRTTTPTSSPATSSWQVAADPDRQHLRVGRRVHLRPQAPVLRRHAAEPEPGHRHRRRPRAAPSSATRSPPTTSRPAGSIKADTPAGKYLTEHGVERKDFNSYGSRRGNHEVMIRGTFANIRLRNQLAPGTEGGFTRDFTQDGGPQSFIYDASQNYQAAGHPAGRPGGQGVRLRLVARLGGQGHRAARRQGRHRRVATSASTAPT